MAVQKKRKVVVAVPRVIHRSVNRITNNHVVELVTVVTTQLNLYKQIYSDKTNKISRELINLGTVKTS